MTDKVKIGSALKAKPQQYERRDPWPNVPFVAPDLPDVCGRWWLFYSSSLGCRWA